jgi:biotin carboxylase
VRLCNTVDEARRQAQTILAVSENVRGQQATQVVLVEAYLDAPEYSVEMFSWQGETFCVGITEKLLLPPPSFVEHRHVFPAPLQADVVSEMEQTVTQALATVGYRDGASHTEIKYTAEGSAIVEINARLAGGMIPELITLVTGLDLLEQQCRVASGQKPCLHADRDGFAGIQFLVSSVAGTLREIRGVEQCIAVDGITEVNIMASVGKSVTTAQSAYDRLGYVIAQGKSYDETVRRMRVASDLIEMHM